MAKPISIASSAGTFEAELALPEGGPAPAIIVVPSIFGNTDGLKATLDRYASHGYIVLAIDPFWRTAPGPRGQDEREAASARAAEWTVENGLADVQAAVETLKTMPAWNGKYAVMGFCFGGRLAMLGLTRLDADAAVSFHGTRMHLHAGEADKVTKPFSFHYGGDDPVVPLDEVAQVQAALAGKDGEIYIYPGAGHSFAQQESPRYSPEAGPLSEARALAVLERLKTPVGV